MPRKLALIDLERSGLTRSDAQKMKIEVYKAEETEELGLSLRAAGYKIPYLDSFGKPTGFFRYRLLENVATGFHKLTGRKSPKYLQPPGTLPEVYLPPFVKWADLMDDGSPLIITEGEKKAAAATKAGLPTIGLGGVWSFQSKKHGIAFLDGLEQFDWKRVVYIVFDSDASANKDVRMAANRLSHLLTERGAEVYLGYLPALADKVGLDDYLLTHTPKELEAWLEKLQPVEASRALHDMNELVTYVMDPGVVVVNETGQQLSPGAFRDHAFATHSYTVRIEKPDGSVGMRTLRTAKEWLQWPGRAQVRRLVYEPGEPEVVNGDLNLWPGYSVEPQKGDIRPWRELLDFLFGGDVEAQVWFERWAAYPFQHPGAKLKQAVLIWGLVRGTGKSLVAVTLGDLYGENFSLITDRDFNGDFNPWAHRKQFVLYDEVSPSGSRERANLLKNLVTRERVTVNIKYLPQFEIRDCINYYLASNHPDALYIEPGERRYFVHEVKAEKPLPREFYDRYAEWRESMEGKAALLYHLLTLPLGDFHPHAAAPRTQAFNEMVGASRTELEHYLEDIFLAPEYGMQRFGGGDLVSLHELAAMFEPADGRRPATTLVARKLKQMGIEPILTRFMLGPNRTNVYAAKNRAKWAKATAAQVKWHFEETRAKARKGVK